MRGLEVPTVVFGGSSAGTVHNGALKDMRELYRYASRDMGIGLSNEFGDRWEPVQLSILLGFLIAYSYERFWDHPRKDETLERFRAEMRDAHWDALASSQLLPKDPTQRAGHRTELEDEIAFRYDGYEERMALDLDRMQVYSANPGRLSETVDESVRRVFVQEDLDADRASRMMLARLHAYFRAAVYNIQHL